MFHYQNELWSITDFLFYGVTWIKDWKCPWMACTTGMVVLGTWYSLGGAVLHSDSLPQRMVRGLFEICSFKVTFTNYISTF